MKAKNFFTLARHLLKAYAEAKDLGGSTGIVHRGDWVAVSQTADSHTHNEPQAARKEAPPIQTLQPELHPHQYSWTTATRKHKPLTQNHTWVRWWIPTTNIYQWHQLKFRYFIHFFMQMITMKTIQIMSHIPHIHHNNSSFTELSNHHTSQDHNTAANNGQPAFTKPIAGPSAPYQPSKQPHSRSTCIKMSISRPSHPPIVKFSSSSVSKVASAAIPMTVQKLERLISLHINSIQIDIMWWWVSLEP